MQKFLLKFSFVAIALTLLIATGCGEDEDPIFTNDLPPSIALNSGAGLITSNAELLPGETFSVNISMATGDNPLQSFTFLVDGVAPNNTEIANYYSEFAINGSTEVSNNPITLFGAAKDGSTIDITIKPYQQMPGEIRTYTFEVEDEAKEFASISIDITILDDPTTPLDSTLTGVFFNRVGSGAGSLNLLNGQGVNLASTSSHIRDMGVDCTINPDNAENWRKQIHSVNGAVMKAVDPAVLGENFSFDAVDNKEAVLAAFETGITLANGLYSNPQCETTSVTNISDVVSEGDMFAVERDGIYFLIRIDEVNAVSGNSDNYVISIKY